MGEVSSFLCSLSILGLGWLTFKQKNQNQNQAPKNKPVQVMTSV